MDLLIGILLLIGCIGVAGHTAMTGGDWTDLRTISQLTVTSLGSLYILRPFIKQMVGKIDVDLTDTSDDTGELMDITEKELEDYKALQYLKDRANELGSDEMLKALAQINNLLFVISVKKDK